MRNKGFTLVEILAVIVILGLLVTIATLSVTRIRKNADDKDLLNLHDSLQTSFANYRSVLAMNGDVLSAQTLNISSSQSSGFDRYIQDLSYNGKRLSKADKNNLYIDLSSCLTLSEENENSENSDKSNLNLNDEKINSNQLIIPIIE